MKKTLLLLIAPLSILTACASMGNQSLSSTPSSSTSEAQYYIDQNGDYSSLSFSSYEDLPAYESKKEISHAKKGYYSTFINASCTCSHCLKLEPIFLEAAKKGKYYFETIYLQEETVEEENRYNSLLQPLQLEYGVDRYNGGISGEVPTIYTLSSQGLHNYDFYSNNSSANKLYSYFQTQFIKTNIYHFSNFEAYKKEIANNQDILTFAFNSDSDEDFSFYLESIYNKAKTSQNKLFYVDFAKITDLERNKFESLFSPNEPLLIQNSINIKINSEEASSLLENYFK